MAGEYLIDPPAGAGCPIGVDGWRIVVDAWYNAAIGSRVYGSDVYGAGVYGDTGGAGISTWVDLTESVTGTVVTRGTRDGTYRQPVDRLEFDVIDDDATIWNIDPDAVYAIRAGAPMRAGLLDPSGSYHPLSTGRLETIDDTHDEPPRILGLEAVGMLTDLVVDRIDVARPEETASVRAAYYLNLAPWTWSPIPSAVSAIVLAAEPTPDTIEVRGELDRIARSTGIYQSTDRRGAWQSAQWPILAAATDPLEVVDCPDPTASPFSDAFAPPFGADRRMPTAAIGYVEDRAALLNLVQMTKAGGAPADSVTVDDDISIAVNGVRSNTYGMPWTDGAYKNAADLAPVATRILTRFGNLTARVESFTFDSAADARWIGHTAALDIGRPVRVARTEVAPLELDAVIVGYVLRLDRNQIRGTVYVQPIGA